MFYTIFTVKLHIFTTHKFRDGNKWEVTLKTNKWEVTLKTNKGMSNTIL